MRNLKGRHDTGWQLIRSICVEPVLKLGLYTLPAIAHKQVALFIQSPATMRQTIAAGCSNLLPLQSSG